MKELFTAKFSMISSNGIYSDGGRGYTIIGGRYRGRKGRERRKERNMKTLILIPIVGAISLYFKPSKKWALMISVGTMIEALRLYIGMDKKSTEFQYVERIV